MRQKYSERAESTNADRRFSPSRAFSRAIIEGEACLKEWAKNWDDLVDFEIVPVRTSEQAAAAIAPEL